MQHCSTPLQSSQPLTQSTIWHIEQEVWCLLPRFLCPPFGSLSILLNEHRLFKKAYRLANPQASFNFANEGVPVHAGLGKWGHDFMLLLEKILCRWLWREISAAALWKRLCHQKHSSFRISPRVSRGSWGCLSHLAGSQTYIRPLVVDPNALPLRQAAKTFSARLHPSLGRWWELGEYATPEVTRMVKCGA